MIFYLLLVWSPMAGLLFGCHPRVSVFHKRSKQNTACDLSPNDLNWADVRAQKLILWQWATFSDSEGRQMPHHIKYQKADAVPKVTDMVTRMMAGCPAGCQTGSRTTMHGNWAGNNWLKLHHMKKVITRREGYNQEISWISGITILQASHNYCICIGHGRTLCQKKAW